MTDMIPSDAAFDALEAAHQGPTVMINLLKFTPRTPDGRTGAEAYDAYGAEVARMIRAVGGEVLWWGLPKAVLLGGEADAWDAVAIVRYPQATTLREMMASPAYQAIHVDRDAALARTVLIGCAEIPLGRAPPTT